MKLDLQGTALLGLETAASPSRAETAEPLADAIAAAPAADQMQEVAPKDGAEGSQRAAASLASAQAR